MTATATKTTRQQLDEMMVRLETKAKQLLLAEVWDDLQIELTAKLRWAFTELIGRSDQDITNYLSLTWGECGFWDDEVAKGVPFQADQWTCDNQPAGFIHDYLSQYCEGHVPYLPEGWLEIPRDEFDWNVQPVAGEKMLDLLYGHTSVQDAEDLMEVDALGKDRKLCGEALVMTGYLTNQENLTGDDLIFLQVYKVFRDILEETLANEEEG